MLTNIKIKKLFDIFDYDIEFKEEGITILTAPNGYGKTTILKILDALASKNVLFFIRLLFQKITLEFSDGNTIVLEKKENDILITQSDSSTPWHWNNESLENMLKPLPFFRQIEENRWVDRRTDEIYTKEDLLQTLKLEFPEIAIDLPPPFSKVPLVYFISAQRLLRPISNSKIKGARHFNLGFDKEINAFTNAIEEYAQELRDIIKDVLAKSSQISQKLDSSFPRRLFELKQDISEEEFNRRFDKVKDIQKSLSQYGLSDIKEDSHPTYKLENAKALSVYISDSEEKLAVFMELLKKLNIFTEILNERRFTFKRIAVSKENGFKFTTDNSKHTLALGDLSSGEQQEVVLLYELLFKVKEGTLVLIDEPELSLHVVWQKQFLDDLLKIINLQKINIIVATHSPQIINNHWDLTVDLEELRNAKISG